MIDLEPLGTRIIVKRKEVGKVGMILIPESSREMEATEGDVIGVGEDCCKVKMGDVVFFGRYAGANIERNGSKCILMDEDDVLARVKPAGGK